MAHPEKGVSEVEATAGARRLVTEGLALWKEAFRLARLVLKDGEPVSWQDREGMEHYYSYVPMIAAKIYDDMLGGSGFAGEAPEKTQRERFDNVMAMAAAMREAANDLEQKAKA